MAAVFVMLGASAGTSARFLVSRSERLTRPGLLGVPVPTLLVNLLGSLLLGIVVGLATTAVTGATYMVALAGTGFCGAFTTMSTFSVEVLQLVHRRQWAGAAVYLTVSIVVGVALVFLGAHGITRLV